MELKGCRLLDTRFRRYDGCISARGHETYDAFAYCGFCRAGGAQR
ncbi:MAG: hypothetical protein QOD09_2111 [Bradyrhizobium sp.]|nr:hypothetical protein [Bradyrhizobium sp.]